jgi:carbamoyltransferase
MVVLGLAPNHDSSVCIIVDGTIVAAITRERLSRKKKDRYVTQRMIDYVLSKANLTINDVDYVAISYWYENRMGWVNENEDFKFYVHEDDAQIFSVKYTPNTNNPFEYEKPLLHEGLGYRIHDDLIYLAPPYTFHPHDSIRINFEMYGRVIPGWFVSHQHAHAASTFYTSNFERAAIFTADSTDINPYSSSLFSWGCGNRLETLYYPGVMVGHAYSLFTELLNIGHSLWKAGSTMGLAPYGKVDVNIVKKIDEYTKSYWEKKFDGDEWRWVYKLFMETTGKTIKRDVVEYPQGAYTDYFCDFFIKNGSDCKEAMDAAAN